MKKHVLVVGGAGFLGSHVVAELTAAGYRVRALDSLQRAAPVKEAVRSPWIREAELLIGDLRDPQLIVRALHEVDAVVHVAPDGRGASSEWSHAELVALALAVGQRPVETLVVASSLAVYDEGQYRLPSGALTGVPERSAEQLAAGCWEPWSRAGATLSPWPTSEGFSPEAPSPRARILRAREQLCLGLGREQAHAVCVLRLAHVYGPGRAPWQPCASVLCEFGARLLDDRAPRVFEDGLQRRDFVSVYDAARAFRLALEAEGAAGHAVNIGSGRAFPVRDLAQRLAFVLGKQHLSPELTRSCRPGDARHAIPDLALARRALGFEARVGLDEGLIDLCAWLEDCSVSARPKPAVVAAPLPEELRA